MSYAKACTAHALAEASRYSIHTSIVSSECLLGALQQTHVLVPSLPFSRRPFSIDALNLPPRTGRLDVSGFIHKAIAAARRSAWSLQRRSF